MALPTTPSKAAVWEKLGASRSSHRGTRLWRGGVGWGGAQELKHKVLHLQYVSHDKHVTVQPSIWRHHYRIAQGNSLSRPALKWTPFFTGLTVVKKSLHWVPPRCWYQHLSTSNTLSQALKNLYFSPFWTQLWRKTIMWLKGKPTSHTQSHSCTTHHIVQQQLWHTPHYTWLTWTLPAAIVCEFGTAGGPLLPWKHI